MPLTVGNEWTYRTISTIDFVDTLITDVADTSTHTSEITAEDTLNDGTEVFEQVTTYDDTLVGTDTSYVLDNGDYVLGYSDKADAVPDTQVLLVGLDVDVGRALADGYRERVKLATKLPPWSVKARQDMDNLLKVQLSKLKTDHIDYYLLHGLEGKSWEKIRDLGNAWWW
jgi:hypothetical protein